MAWYLNKALTNFRAAVNARWPNRDKESDGTIGNPEHQARVSDHNPDPDDSVDAWDMDVDGVDVELLKRVFQGHESSAYWIHNDQIAKRSTGWQRVSYAYAGPNRNRHLKHVHFNTRGSHERSTAPWTIGAAVADVALTPAQDGALRVSWQDSHCLTTGSPKTPGPAADGGGKTHWTVEKLSALEGKLDALALAVSELSARLEG